MQPGVALFNAAEPRIALLLILILLLNVIPPDALIPELKPYKALNVCAVSVNAAGDQDKIPAPSVFNT